MAKFGVVFYEITSCSSWSFLRTLLLSPYLVSHLVLVDRSGKDLGSSFESMARSFLYRPDVRSNVSKIHVVQTDSEFLLCCGSLARGYSGFQLASLFSHRCVNVGYEWDKAVLEAVSDIRPYVLSAGPVPGASMGPSVSASIYLTDAVGSDALFLSPSSLNAGLSVPYQTQPDKAVSEADARCCLARSLWPAVINGLAIFTSGDREC